MQDQGHRPEIAKRFIHPEASPTEIKIGNIYTSDFHMIGWATKRLGVVPIGSLGQALQGGPMRPVFVERAEIEAAGIDIPSEGAIDHRWIAPLHQYIGKS